MERDIDFKKMFWKVIESWRGILIGMLIGAIGLCAFQYMRDAKTIKALQLEQGTSSEQMEQAMSADELQAVEEAAAVSRQLKAMQAYQSESTLIQLNPFDKNVVVLQYYVDTNYRMNFNAEMTRDNTEDIISSYLAYINNGGLGEGLEIAEDAWNVNELVTAETSDTASTGIFVVRVACAKEEDAQSLTEKLDGMISDYHATVSEKVGDHEITLVDTYVSAVTDYELNQKQMDVMNGITGLQTKLESLTLSFTENQMQMLNGEVEAVASVNNVEYTLQISKRMLVIGAILGAFIFAFGIAVVYILSQKIKDSGEVEKIFGIRIYGSVNGRNKKRILGCVDAWIHRLQGKEKRLPEDELEFLVMKLVMSCKKEGIEKLFLASSTDATESEKKILEQLVQALKKEGITAECGGSVSRSAAAFKQMAEINQVIFWEKCSVTQYTDIEKELRICKEQNANVLGMIIFE